MSGFECRGADRIGNLGASRRLPAAHVKRARMLLLLDEGQAVRDFLTNSCY